MTPRAMQEFRAARAARARLLMQLRDAMREEARLDAQKNAAESAYLIACDRWEAAWETVNRLEREAGV